MGWKIVPNEEHVQCDHRFASQPLANEPLHSSQLFDTVFRKRAAQLHYVGPELRYIFWPPMEAKRWSHWTCSSLGTIFQPMRINSVPDVKYFCNDKNVLRAQSMVWHFVRHPVHCGYSSRISPHFAIFFCYNASKIISNQNWGLKFLINTLKRKVSRSDYLLNIAIQRSLEHTMNHPPRHIPLPLSCSPFPVPVLSKA